MSKILIVEDDESIARAVKQALQDEHYKVFVEGDGEEGYRRAKHESFDLLILDIMLPGKNGTDVCRDLRNDGIAIPILMLTSMGAEIDKVTGLELGADDYVTKPFSLRELIARVKALLRRQGQIAKEVSETTFGEIAVDFKKQELTKKNKPVKMGAKEFQLLKYFVEREGDVITRHQLLDDVWGYESMPTTRTVDNYILSLRKKIESNPSKPKHLLTVHTSGYKFVR
ncbi:MAG TPA: response regulator transcription factor [Bacteroidota bacterium]|nr:response regulator transcription factor [Bacteroidota bacterium]